METVTIVRENKINIELPKRDEHKERVLQTIGKTELLSQIQITTQQKLLKDAGFTFVGKNIEAKFAYKAGINGSYQVYINMALFYGLTLSISIIVGIVLAYLVLLSNGDSLWWMLALSPTFAGALLFIILMFSSIIIPTRIINYVGDIPDFVMDNMQKAQMAGVREFMVYSCEPLPTEEIFAKVDPVMIGWLDDDNTGVVIGIWDRDKEVTI